MTDEQLGQIMRNIFEGAETETIPTFDDMVMDLLADPFKNCLQKGINKVNAKRINGAKGGAPEGNQNARKDKTITPNKEFEKPSIEDEYKVDIPNIQLEDEDIPTIEPEPVKTKVKLETVIIENEKKDISNGIKNNHMREINNLFDNAIANNNLHLNAVQQDIKRLLFDMYKDNEIVNKEFDRIAKEKGGYF